MTNAEKEAFQRAAEESDKIQDVKFWQGFVEVYVDGRTLRHTPLTAADVVNHYVDFNFSLPYRRQHE